MMMKGLHKQTSGNQRLKITGVLEIFLNDQLMVSKALTVDKVGIRFRHMISGIIVIISLFSKDSK